MFYIIKSLEGGTRTDKNSNDKKKTNERNLRRSSLQVFFFKRETEEPNAKLDLMVALKIRFHSLA